MATIDNIVTPPPIVKVTEKLDVTDTSILAAKSGDIKVDKDGQLLRQFLEYRGMTKTLIDVYNNWIAKVLPEQIMSRSIDFGNYTIRFVQPITLLPPYVDNAKLQKVNLTPNMARESDLNYVSNLQISFEVLNKIKGTKERMDNINIGSIPVMIGSSLCATHGKSEQELEAMGECACDPQGYFIVKGSEKNILLQENLRSNRIFVFMNDSGLANCTLTSAILTETSVVNIDIDSYDIMNLHLTMFEKDEKQKNRKIPVFLLFSLYTNYNEVDLVNYILQFTRPEWANKVRRVLYHNMLTAANIDDPEAKLHEIRYKKSDTQKRKEDERKSEKKKRSKRQVVEDEDEEEDDELEEIAREEAYDESVLETKTRLMELLFPHMNSDGPQKKIDLLALMVARLAEHAVGLRQIDERDDWGNKKLESGGRLMEQLFNGIWKKVTEELKSSIRDALKNSGDPVVTAALVEKKINKSAITDDMVESFTPNQWGVRAKDSHSKGYYKANITDYLKRDSLIMTFSHLTRINTPVSRKAKITHIREVQGSQTGYVCPVETPEGEGCGIVKAMSITTQLTTENSDKTKMTEQILLPYITDVKNPANRCKTIFNGRFLGWIDGPTVYPELIRMRRGGIISRDVSIVLDSKDYTLYVYCDSSRPTRPLLIVDGNEVVIDRDDLRGEDFDNLIAEGAVEYIDAFEQNTIMLAKAVDEVPARAQKIKETELKIQEAEMMDDRDQVEMASKVLSRLTNRPFTHSELDPNAMFGVSASLIPFPDRNQAPRNVYQAQMGKQAVGMYHGNYLNRMDTSVKALAFPSRPLFETQMNQVVGLTDMPNGQMVNVAFMTYTGYNQEDAIIFNQSSIDRGLFWYEKLFKFAAVIKSSNDYMEYFMIHPDKIDKDGKITDPEFSKIDPKTNLPYIGAYIERRDVVIPMVRVNTNGTQRVYTDISVRADQGENGYVRRIFKGYNYEGNVVVKVRVSQVRKPIIGDKFASRYAQKGTIGMILPEQDMPFVLGTSSIVYKDEVRMIDGKRVSVKIPVRTGNPAAGMRPDLVINPHCFTADSQILMSNGLTRAITKMNPEGLELMPSLDGTELKTQYSLGWESKGVKPIVNVVLRDGKVLRCTPDHRFKVCGEASIEYCEAKDLKDREVVMGFEGVEDVVGEDEKGWKLDVCGKVFTMENEVERNKTLAFARILGHLATDGSITDLNSTHENGTFNCRSNLGNLYDFEQFAYDVYLLTEKRPALQNNFNKNQSHLGHTYSLHLPYELGRLYGNLDGITVGRKTTKEEKLPAFLVDDTCPKAVVREFVASAFGGDGWAPYILKNRFTGISLSKSINDEHLTSMNKKMNQLCQLIQRFGIDAKIKRERKHYEHQTSVEIHVADVIGFGEKIGFRYCIEKSYRLTIAMSHERYLKTVGKQFDRVVTKTKDLIANENLTLRNALEKAKEQLYENDLIFNEYYSTPSWDTVKNRMRSDRGSKLKVFDYDFIEDARAYVESLGLGKYFEKDEEGYRAYITHKDISSLPTWRLKVAGVIDRNEQEEVYDIGVSETNNFVVSSVAVSNCIPSRMTQGKLIEIISSKLAAMKGERVNATAYKGFSIDNIREQLGMYGFNSQGYEVMANGMTGQMFGAGSYEEEGEEYELTGQLSNARQQAQIFMGPCFYQMLPHHVIDKITARGITGGIDPLTHQPTGGRGSGGQRSGEMERDAMISHGATSLLLERFCYSSDTFTAIMCLNCGTPAVNQNDTNNYTCKKCKEKGKFARLKYPYSTMYLQHMLSALGMDTKFRMKVGGSYIPESVVKEEEVVVEEEDEGEEEDEEEEAVEPIYAGDDIYENDDY